MFLSDHILILVLCISSFRKTIGSINSITCVGMINVHVSVEAMLLKAICILCYIKRTMIIYRYIYNDDNRIPSDFSVLSWWLTNIHPVAWKGSSSIRCIFWILVLMLMGDCMCQHYTVLFGIMDPLYYWIHFDWETDRGKRIVSISSFISHPSPRFLLELKWM